jgi:hypothetical protein
MIVTYTWLHLQVMDEVNELMGKEKRRMRISLLTIRCQQLVIITKVC